MRFADGAIAALTVGGVCAERVWRVFDVAQVDPLERKGRRVRRGNIRLQAAVGRCEAATISSEIL